MPFISYTVDVKLSQASIEDLKQTDVLAARRIRKGLNAIAQGKTSKNLVKALGFAREPEPPQYEYGEFPWVSEAQRKAVMRKLRRNNGGVRQGKKDDVMRYKRTHKLSKGWTIKLVNIGPAGAIIQLANKTNYMTYVQGEWVQPFHHDRWPNVDSTMQNDVIVAGYEDELIDVWTHVMTNQDP